MWLGAERKSTDDLKAAVEHAQIEVLYTYIYNTLI